jgi:outer membrane protein TolC
MPGHEWKIMVIIALAAQASHSQPSFTSLDSVYLYASVHSAASRNSSDQVLLAKKTKAAAVANVISYRSPVSFSATDNLLLPVNFLPAEAFGGAPGTYRQVTLGQEYVSNFNINPQVDLINPYNIARVKSAEANLRLAEINSVITERGLREAIASAWFNISSIDAQLLLLKKNKNLADSLHLILKNKAAEGLLRQQDVNGARVSSIAISEKILQLALARDQQLSALMTLCEIPADRTLQVSPAQPRPKAPGAVPGGISSRQALLQEELATAELRTSQASFFPVLSLVYYQSWQKNSNTSFSDNAAPWIRSKYIGLRITVPFPPEVSRLSQNYTNKISRRIAGVNSMHGKLQEEQHAKMLNAELEKSNASLMLAEETAALRKDSYEKALAQFSEGILPAELLLTSFADYVNSQVSVQAAKAALGFSNEKILLHNQYK